GCVDISSALNVAGGASANFLNLFDQSKTVNLFQKNFDLFSKCAGANTGAAKSRRDYETYVQQSAKRSRFARDTTVYVKRDGLSCPDQSPPATSLVDTTTVQ
ncbi:hypothetical protein FA95DRAFT_1576889, partial [Auriscalpium vulgare]